jgi:uncharacterized membrane protein SpoIIM required for sporulation
MRKLSLTLGLREAVVLALAGCVIGVMVAIRNL